MNVLDADLSNCKVNPMDYRFYCSPSKILPRYARYIQCTPFLVNFHAENFKAEAKQRAIKSHCGHHIYLSSRNFLRQPAIAKKAAQAAKRPNPWMRMDKASRMTKPASSGPDGL